MLKDRFTGFIQKKQLFQPTDRLLIAVSGGLDSVVLCELCHQCGYQFNIAHCNFQLRGEESERDADFVKKLGKKYQCQVFIKEFDTETYALKKRISIQEAARELRYTWFNELLTEPGGQHSPIPVYLLTAHHLDDNTETVMMNFFRGTGLHGLTGIPVANNKIRRPLLDLTRSEIEDFAKQNNLEWVEDSSNQSSKYTRNFFRNELIPSIEKVYPEVKANLAANIHRFTEAEKLYRLGVDVFRKKLFKQKGNEIHIPVKQLMGYGNHALYYELISPFGFSEKQIPELIKLSESGSGKYIESTDHKFRIIRHRHWFIISPIQTSQSENIIITENDKQISFALGFLQIQQLPNFPGKGRSHKPQTALLDGKTLEFPLLLRKVKTADYFYPLGMKKKKKKISRFLIDLKLSKTEKENIWVIESAKRICWVVGHRIDERFKITEQTAAAVEMQVIP
jgi:tRNA(Ile)-lysidine synthase